MNLADILNLLDEISNSLVFSEDGETAHLEQLPEKFGDVAAIVRELGREEEAGYCHQAITLAARLVSGEVDWVAGMDVLGRTLNALQACLSDECPVAEAGFPVELSEGVAESAASDPSGEASTEESASGAPGQDVGALVDDGIMSEFLSRQNDVLQDVEKHLLNLEEGNDGDSEWLLRFFHTLKGESALLGLTDVAELCHTTEDMMQKEPMPDCVDRLLDVKDWFVTTFRHLTEEGPAAAPLSEMLLIVQASPEAEDAPVHIAPEVQDVTEEAAAPETEPVVEAAPASAPALPAYEVKAYVGQNILEGDVDLIQDFIEEAVEHLDASEVHLLTIESNPRETEALNAVFRGFHTIKGLAGFIELDHVQDLAHKAENLLDMGRRGELELVGTNMDLVFESVDMMKRLVNDMASALGGSGALTEEPNLPGLMSRLVVATSDEAAAAPAPAPAPEPVAVVEPEPEPVETPVGAGDEKPKISGFVPLGNMKKKAPQAKPAPEPVAVVEPVAAVEPATPAAPSGKAKAPVKMKEAVRVDSERLDRLIETIGELVIAESMVTQSPEIKGSAMSVKLAKDIDHLDKICRELQEIGMSLRMVPVRPVFQKMARLVRDLSKKQNRQVDFVMTGEDTELDKNVVDKIGDPLVHMVRNSVDHGIEPDPADRTAAGKPERGRVELRAFHKGGNICIEIEDDGRGLDRDAILAKAISRGLVREGENVSDRDIYNMVFEAGFSTAKKVTDISGRGVGMDVVRRNIEELRGTVDITSEKGKGSTFSIKLPLTLAIIEGMVIMVGAEHYIIPTLTVVRLIRPRPEDISHVFDRGEMLAFEGGHLPLFRLSTLFDVEEAKAHPHEAVVVVVEDEGKRVGLLADHLLGQQSIVIKSLGESVQGTDGVAGGAIMSNGQVALILDVAGIVRVAHNVDTSVLVRPAVAATLDPTATASAVEVVADVIESETAEPERIPAGILT